MPYEKTYFLTAAVAFVLSTIAACSSGGKNANQPVTYTYVFSSPQLWTTQFLEIGTKQVTGNVIDSLRMSLKSCTVCSRGLVF